MKKLFAISAFLIFFFSQFGKVINFCFCTVSAFQQTNSFHCDCEKQLVTTTDTDTNKQPHSNPVQLQQSEDLYHLHNSTAFSCTRFSPSVIYLHTPPEPLYKGYCSTIFHPPGNCGNMEM